MRLFLMTWLKFIGFLALAGAGAGVMIAILSLLMDHVGMWAAGTLLFFVVTGALTAAYIDMTRA